MNGSTSTSFMSISGPEQTVWFLHIHTQKKYISIEQMKLIRLIQLNWIKAHGNEINFITNFSNIFTLFWTFLKLKIYSKRYESFWNACIYLKLYFVLMLHFIFCIFFYVFWFMWIDGKFIVISSYVFLI